MNLDLAMDSERLAKLDVLLNQHPPFGDSEYILARVQTALRRRLDRAGEQLPSAAELVATLDGAPAETRSRTYRDPVLRAAIQNAFSEVVSGRPYGLGLAHCGEVFRETADAVRQGCTDGPLIGLGCLDRVHPQHDATFAWCDDGSDRAGVRALRRLVLENFGDPVGSFNAAMLRAVHDGVRLATDVLPLTAASALRHTSLVVTFPRSGAWRTRASGSQFRLTGAVFLAGADLQCPWWVAEHLLHEALHQKLYDIRHSHSLFSRDDPELADDLQASDRTIPSVWNEVDHRSSNHLWGVTRAMAAFHVYAHLALFGLVSDARQSELEAGYGQRPTGAGRLTSTQEAVERARYTGLQIREQLREQLGRAGQALCDWLSDFLDELGPASSREALRLSLTLERSRRELRAFDQPGSADQRALAELVAGERTAIDVALGLSATSSAPADVAPEATIIDVRRQTLGTLRSFVNRYEDDWSDSVRGTLTQLCGVLDDSTQRLARVQAESIDLVTPEPTTSAAISVAEREAALLDWTRVFGPRYGTTSFSRFLYSLIRMHRPATLVELGTGHGVSALWMAHALEENGTGQLWTIDDLSHAGDLVDVLTSRATPLTHDLWDGLPQLASTAILPEAARRLGLDRQVTFVDRRIDLGVPGHFADYPFATPVDLLFSDFAHGPDAVLALLGHFLPLMAGTASVFIDSASTSWPSYLLLEQVVGMLSRREVPAVLQRMCSQDLTPLVARRRFHLTHLTKADRLSQNSTAWLRIEPIDLRPHPAVAMHDSGRMFS